MATPGNKLNINYHSQWLVLGLLLAVLCTALSFNLYFERRLTLAREESSLAAQARTIAKNMEYQLQSANVALEGLISDRLRWKGTSDAQNQALYLRALAEAMSGVRTIAVIDAAGKVLSSNRYELIGSNMAHRDYFQSVKQEPNPQMLYISAPFNSTLNPETYVVNLSKMIPGATQEFAGVVAITLDPDYFKTLMASVLYAPDMWDAITHTDGQVFLTEPAHNHKPRLNLSRAPSSLFNQHIASGQDASLFRDISYTTDTFQIMAQRTVRPPSLVIDKPLVVSVSRDQDAVLTSWYSDVIRRMSFLFIFSLFTCLGLYAFQRRQREYERETATTASALQSSEENYRLIVENTADLVIKLDITGRYTYLNPAFCELFNATAKELQGKHYWEAVIPEQREAAYEYLQKLFRPPYMANSRQKENTGKGVRHLEWTGRGIRDSSNQVVEIVSIGRDITEHMQLMGQLAEQAQRDYLTSLVNRRHFTELATAEILRAQRYSKTLSLFMLDIDHFKSINDTYGHQTGDLVLKKLSSILTEALRTVDIIARVGGEEFAVILPETSLDEAAEVAERLRQTIANSAVLILGGKTLHFKVSIGVTALPVDNRNITLDILFGQADAALYRAKQSGRNQVCFADHLSQSVA